MSQQVSQDTRVMSTNEQAAGMLCPLDKTALVMSDRQGIEIDYCPTCRGVWLDRGELDKIIERSGAQSEPATQPQPAYDTRVSNAQPRGSYDDHGYRDGGYRKGKKKSFLSELFD